MSTTSSRRTRRTKRVRYTYDSDSELESRPSARTVPIRTSRRIQSYREDSEDDVNNSNQITSSSESDNAVPQPTERTANSNRSKNKSHSRNKRSRPRRSARHSQSFELFKRRKPNPSQHFVEAKAYVEIPISGRIPPWQSLPYEILLLIFKYAAYPLYGQASRATPSIAWLCGVSSLCKPFHDASIAALLYDPPLYPSYRARELIQLLRQDQKKTMLNYRNKIKCLNVEAKHLLINKSGIDLEDLIDHTPLLERLRVYHNHDDLGTVFWAHPSQAKGKRWSYPDGLFDKLDEHNIQLKSFEWNGRFPNSVQILSAILSHHARPCFSQLRELSFLNIDIEERNTEITALANDTISQVLASLPNLKHLSFRNCNILNTTTVSHLPLALVSLSITNCPSLTADILSVYLASGGSSLTSLSLSGNQCMSLSFLAQLSTLCPHLQHLNLNLTYIDPSLWRDTDPLFDDALPDGPPTWPPSLVTLDIENLRQITSAEAEDFFQSLVVSAPSLAHLRALSIKAIIKNASWRDRAKLRQEWHPRLEEVFLDRSEPLAHVPRKREPKPLPPKKEGDRHSSRIQHLKHLSISQSDSNDSDSALSFSQPNNNRSAERMIASRRTTTAGSTANGETEPFRQGRCNVVNLVLSDQRPAQDQYHEADFLDDEPSDDGEWNGRDLEFN